MNIQKTLQAFFVVSSAFGLIATTGCAKEVDHSGHSEGTGKVCEGFGPQTPRDIDSKGGENKRVFSLAPGYKDMNLCNIHFHVNAEHKAKDFSIYAGEGEHGHGGGYQCNDTKNLTKKRTDSG